MADEAESTEGEKKKGGILPLIAVALVAAGAGGGAAFFLLGSDPAPAAAEEVVEAEAEAEEPGDAPAATMTENEGEALLEKMVELSPFVVNVTDEGLRRYLKVKLELELVDGEQRTRVEASKAQIRDAIIVLLSAKRMADLSQFEGKLLLKDEIRDRVNALFGGNAVRSVLFTEFVVQ